MREVLKTIALMLLFLSLYVGVTSLIGYLFCLLFGIVFDFFISLFFWFSVPFLVVCAIISCEGGIDNGR